MRFLLAFAFCIRKALTHFSGMGGNLLAQLKVTAQRLEGSGDCRNFRGVGCGTVQPLALSLQLGNFVFQCDLLCLQLLYLINAVCRQKLHLPDPSVKITDVLPYSIAGAAGLMRQRTQLVQIAIVQGPQAGEPAGLAIAFAQSGVLCNGRLFL